MRAWCVAGYLLSGSLSASSSRALSSSRTRLFASGLTRRMSMGTTGGGIIEYASGPNYKIAQFPARSDNYGFLLHDDVTGATAAIDTPEVGPILDALEANAWRLTHILNTHHHHDHAGGNADLRKRFPTIQIIAPLKETNKIGHVDVGVQHDDMVQVGALQLRVIDVGGHTLGHVAYYSELAKSAFVGDAIFAMGCGRMFEGTYPQFTASLNRITLLPDDTVLYCAHEYTQANAKFALTVEPENGDLVSRAEDVFAKRSRGEPTVPTTVKLEKLTNPFIRPDAVKKALGLPADMPDVDVFAHVRQKKDRF